MTARERLRRALLFMPGDDWHKIAKAAGTGADALILDLEDGVAVSRKQAARQTVARALTSGEIDFGRAERLVRLNPPSSGWFPEDLEAAIAGRPDGLVIPKVEGADDLREAAERIARAEARSGLPAGSVSVLALIETARGVVALRDIATATDRLAALLFGAEDLAGSLGAVRTPEGMEVFFARSMVVLHAAAAGVQAIDSPCVRLDDPAALAREVQQALAMGYSGKLAIHPAQVGQIQDAFTPSPDEIERARRLVEAHGAHQADGAGAFAYEGKMVDMPMIRAAERVLARARAAGKG